MFARLLHACVHVAGARGETHTAALSSSGHPVRVSWCDWVKWGNTQALCPPAWPRAAVEARASLFMGTSEQQPRTWSPRGCGDLWYSDRVPVRAEGSCALEGGGSEPLRSPWACAPPPPPSSQRALHVPGFQGLLGSILSAPMPASRVSAETFSPPHRALWASIPCGFRHTERGSQNRRNV